MKLWKSLIASCSLIALMGCGLQITVEPPDEFRCIGYELIINPFASNIPWEEISDAAEYWNTVAGRTVFIVSPFLEPDIDIREVAVFDDRYKTKAGLAFASWGDITGELQGGCTILLRRGVWDWAILRHELGHCLGFPHDDPEQYPQSIMNAYIDMNPRSYPYMSEHLQDCGIRRYRPTSNGPAEDAGIDGGIDSGTD